MKPDRMRPMRQKHMPLNESLEAVFRSELDGLYRMALRLLGSREEAEDAVQDAYIRVAGASSRQEMPKHPRGWIFRVLRNLCIDRLRTRTSRLRVVTAEKDIETLAQHHADPRTPESDLLNTDALDRVARALDAMPRELSEVLSLVVIENLSYREAAAVTGVPLGTVRSRLSRARDMLRSLVESPDLPRLSGISKVRS